MRIVEESSAARRRANLAREAASQIREAIALHRTVQMKRGRLRWWTPRRGWRYLSIGQSEEVAHALDLLASREISEAAALEERIRVVES